MQVKDELKWQSILAANQSEYGKDIMEYAKRWTELMESKIAAGEQLSDIARQTSLEANTTGISAFMYAAAVCTLSAVWVHGETLRQWHSRVTSAVG